MPSLIVKENPTLDASETEYTWDLQIGAVNAEAAVNADERAAPAPLLVR
jgi:hypothetical protein